MKKATKIYYGGDYNPDQWDMQTIYEDMRLFKKARINLLTLPVFSWTKLEPSEGNYDFSWLDQLLDLMWENGIQACLATPTTAQPAWMSVKYPEVLPVDIAGRKRTHGMRVFFCYNSPIYRKRAAAIASEMAKRYTDHPALAVWHVSNEYGTFCYCDNCQSKFRLWLKERYGSLDELNKRWHTSFWGRTLTDWNEIFLPSELNDDYRFCPTIQLDYQRFVTASTAECFRNEYDAIRLYDEDTPIQTNISGYIKKLDQFEMAKQMDVIGWDNYPTPGQDRSLVALKHDIMRGLRDGQSYMVMEQSPNQQNWQPYNRIKRPGEVRILAYQGLAHGADTSLFFQMRQSIAGQEKFHGAIISRSGSEDTRVFREITELGEELTKLSDIIGARSTAKVGILMDWNSWWALENCSGPNKDIDYLETLRLYYAPFYRRNIPVDILAYHRDISEYEVVILPMGYMMKEGLAEKLISFVQAGGILIGTVMTGIADENDRCLFGDAPGPLKSLFGLSVEETDALLCGEKNKIRMNDGRGYESTLLCDIIHTTTAETLAVHGEEFYQGTPCFTVNHYGNGKAYYIGTQPDEAFLDHVAALVNAAPLMQAADGVEITRRENANGVFYFCLNHTNAPASLHLGDALFTDMQNNETMQGSIQMNAYDVKVLQLQPQHKGGLD